MVNKDMLDNNRRLLQIRNPWSRGGIPKSAFSTSDLWDALPSPTPNEAVDEDKLSGLSVGTFWVDYTVLSQSFKTLYLNWNPALFQYCQRRHLSFAPSGSDFDVGGNGQFSISVGGTGDVWILVERHYLGKSEGWEGYIGLAVFPGNERIYSYTRATYRVHSSFGILTIDGICRWKSHFIKNIWIPSKTITYNPRHSK